MRRSAIRGMAREDVVDALLRPVDRVDPSYHN
jgi:hypothetical protein